MRPTSGRGRFGAHLKKGDRVLLCAFGGGFTWGASVLEWWGVPIPDRREKPILERAARRVDDLLDRVRPV